MFTDQSALIIAIELPKNNFASKSYYLKVRDRASYAFALVAVAAALETNGTQIIGGAEDRENESEILKEFVRLPGRGGR